MAKLSQFPLTWQCCPETPVCPRGSVWPSVPPAAGPVLSSSHSPVPPVPHHGLTQSWTSLSFSSGQSGCLSQCLCWAGGGERSNHCLDIVSDPPAPSHPPPRWPARSHWSHGSWGSCSWARTGLTHSQSSQRTACPVWLWEGGVGGGRSHHGVAGGSHLLSAGSLTTSQGQSGSGPKPASHHQGPG